MRLLKTLACCAAALLLGACSTTRLAYDHLDTLLHWQVSNYVELTPPQRQAFDVELYPLWRWHRQSQLPLYAADLRQLAGEVQAGPLDAQQIEAASTRIRAHWDSLVGQAVPDYAGLLAQLSDAQVADMVGHIGKEIDRKAHKRQKQSQEQRQQKRVDEMQDSLREWIGSPNAAQRQLIQQWAAQAPVLTQEQEQQRQQRQHQRLDRYAALLAGRAQPEFEPRLLSFFMASDMDSAEQQRSPERQDREQRQQLLAALAPTLEPAQRDRLRQRLLDYAADFEALAAEPPKQGPDAVKPAAQPAAHAPAEAG